MKLNIKDIGPEGVDLEWALDGSEVEALMRSASVEVQGDTGEARLCINLTRATETVVVRGTMRGRFEILCVRCLGKAAVALDESDLVATFVPGAAEELADTADDELEHQLVEEDLDTFTHDGKTVDLETLLREAMVLSIPIAPLCSEDCRGICHGCGADLNRDSCSCQGESTETPQWASALGQLKKKMFKD